MEEILLSICIPTYNRPDYLRENLEHLLCQIEPYKSEIEIILNDNLSDNDPKDMTCELSTEYNFPILYSRNFKHVDAENNFAIAVSKAKGKYIFLMGDDDIVSPNFFDIIIPLLQKKEIGILHWGRLKGDAFCSNNVMHDPEFTGTIMELPIEDFIRRVMSSPNFLSSVLFNRRCWEIGEKHLKEEYYGYKFFAQIYWGALELKKSCIYYYFPLVLMRGATHTWSRLAVQYFIVGMSNIFFDLNTKIPGVYQLWRKRMHDYRFYDVTLSLSGVLLDRNFYRRIKDEMIPHLNGGERCLLYTYLYFPFPHMTQFIINRMIGIYRMLTKRIKK